MGRVENASDSTRSAHSAIRLAFFCSGVSGLIYQVSWVRQFGNVFGNTVHSAAIVVAVFMLGLGAGGWLAGRWADRRAPARPAVLMRAYAGAELVLATLGLILSRLLPHLDSLVAGWSSYAPGTDGWFALTTASYLVRLAAAVLLLTPIAMTMGATLTLLIRYVVRADVGTSGPQVAWLYGVNTAGAAAGALVTDFALVPIAGLEAAQIVAVGLNLVAAAIGARVAAVDVPAVAAASPPAAVSDAPARRGRVPAVAIALALSGCAAMGMEMVWLRHFTILLGGFRAVFSLVLTVLLVGSGAGALLGGWLVRRWSRPADLLVAGQALFVVCTLLGLASADASALAAGGRAVAATLGLLGPARRALAELWFELRPMLFEIGLPALVAGFSFPLANAIAQQSLDTVGRRAGLLYGANTAGAVCGSLVAGYVLLPGLGLQAAAATLAALAALAIVPLAMAGAARRPVAVAAVVAVVALAGWQALPADYLLRHALEVPRDQRVLATSEGMTEVIAVVEAARGRALLTNGHAMSSTALLDQRYMRALAHVPLLSMDVPRRVLVIGFGVGNTTHAATLHPSVERVDVAELSRHVLAQARYFRDANHDVLHDPKVAVFINDGRQHLQMTGPGAYDLVTLEPPPIAHAGVGALYSREFYALVRSRLAPGGYVSQWLPAYQVPRASSLAMVRAFLDVFPQAVLLSGAQAELLLVGTTAPRIEIDPARLEQALRRAPAARADLARLDLGTPRELVGSFVGSAATLRAATREAPAVTDDRPLQEYGVRSGLSTGLNGVPASLFNLADVAAWCPRCFDSRGPVPSVAGLDTYFGLLAEAYEAPVTTVEAAVAAAGGHRRVLGSAYLGFVLPDSAEVYNIVGTAERERGRVEDAAHAFEAALRLAPASPAARQNLGQVRLEQGRALLEARRYGEAAAELREATALLPESAAAYNDLGVALASSKQVAEAATQFRRAVALDPGFAEARRNLSAAETLAR